MRHRIRSGFPWNSTGRQAVLAYAKESHQGRLADRQTRHHMSALVFLELSTDHAVTENMALITHQTADDSVPFISGSGIYRNTWKKTQQGWRIAERILFTDRFHRTMMRYGIELSNASHLPRATPCTDQSVRSPPTAFQPAKTILSNW